MSSTARPLLLALLLLVASAGAAAPAAPAAAPEDEMLRQIKNDVFDEKWDSVFADCDRLIQSYPASGSLPRAYYYRAKALQHMPGRETDAVAAWSDFIEKFPSDPPLREDALISRIDLAKGLWLQGKKENINILTKGLDEKGYPRIYAAIQISNVDNK